MPLRHEGKKGGSGPLKGGFGITSLLKPAKAIEKNTVKRLSFPQTPHSGRPRSAIPDTKRLHSASPAVHVIPPAAHVIPAEASATERNLCAAVQETRTYKERPHQP